MLVIQVVKGAQNLKRCIFVLLLVALLAPVTVAFPITRMYGNYDHKYLMFRYSIYYTKLDIFFLYKFANNCMPFF